MKKIHLLFLAPLFMIACKGKPAANTAAAPVDSAKTDTTKYNFPFGIKNPDEWDMNHNNKNSALALNVLKAFEMSDTATMRKYLADTVTFQFDGGMFKGTAGDLNKQIKGETNKFGEIKLRIVDVESVISKLPKKEEWVSVWYIQKTKDLKGKADSVALVNDILIKDDKIIKIDEYQRHFKM